MNMKRCMLIILLLSAKSLLGFGNDRDLKVTSPDGKLSLRLSLKESVFYSVDYKGENIISPSLIELSLSGQTLGRMPKSKRIVRQKKNGSIALPYGNFKKLREQYNELEVEFAGNYSIIVRAYNQGVAYRFKTKFDSAITVINEEANFNFQGAPSVSFPESDTFTSWEVPYVQYASIASIAENKKAITPLMFSYEKINVAIAESDVLDYPGMYLKKHQGSLKGEWAKYPKRTELGSWGNFVSVVKETCNFIAKTEGSREFPWRIIMPSDNDKTFLTNSLVYLLAKPAALTDVSWVKPGKAAWEWWHCASIEDADIPTGFDNRNTALYKLYVDFASDNKLEYLMVDAGWSDIFDITKVNQKIDMRELINYAASKNVKVFLWCVATAVIDDPKRGMEAMRRQGVAGLKIDFIDRDDQIAIAWFEKLAAAAAEQKLMIDFHGCSKPTGLERAYPNIVNYEAARGAECSKWDFTANPDHHMNLLFTRMLAGPLDYTPGSMRNKTKAAFQPADCPALSSTQGTRCHELAMYILFYQPFAMLCDSPFEYRKYPDIMKYLAAVPVSFDNTLVLDGKAGEYALLAKQKGDEWFIGAMTNWNSPEFPLDFFFLPSGPLYGGRYLLGRKNANSNAEEYEYKTMTIDKKSKLNLTLARGGGAVIYLHK